MIGTIFAVVPLYAFLLGLFPPVVSPTSPAGLATKSGEETHAASASAPQRVVVFPPVLWDYLTIDDSAAHVMAIARYLHVSMVKGLLGRVFPEAGNTQIVSTVGENSAIPGDPEQLIFLKPDAVLSWAWLSEPLRAIRFPGVIEVNYDGEEPDKSAFVIWNQLARVTQKSDRSDALLKRYSDKRASLEAMIPAQNGRRLRVAIISSYGNSHTLIGKKDFLYDRLQSLGGENCAPSRNSSDLDPEELILLDPDIIVLMSYEDDTYMPQDVYEDSRFRYLKAVRDRKVYKMPFGGSRMEGPVEEPLLLEWLAELFHPERMPHRLRSEFKETYEGVYHYRLNNDEIDRTLFLKENLFSAGYARFARAEALP